jgi:hypothetical protein
MITFAIPLLCAGLTLAEPEAAPFGYLYQPAYTLEETPRLPAEIYEPQPGDLIFFTDHSFWWYLCFWMSCTSDPMHAGIIVRMPDGKLAALESGYNDTIWVRNIPLDQRLHEFEGTIWIRRVAQPLTEEQRQKLTDFAVTIDGRLFAVPRLLRQMTPFRTRGPLRTFFMGKPHGLKRKAYFCSESVLEACVYAGLLDPTNVRPSATYPRDMFFDHSMNLFLNKYFKLAPYWVPPQLWTTKLPAK